MAAADGDRRLSTVIRDGASGKWRRFDHPIEIIVARRIEEVLPALCAVEDACGRGRYAAGYLSYEAAPAFDAALQTQDASGFPFLWFGVYDGAEDCSLDELDDPKGDVFDEHWEPSLSAERYARVFDQLQELIRNGDTYQVNYTYRLRARLRSDPFALFLRLADVHRPPFGAYLETEDWAICSVSPELFFHRAGNTIESRPMKGTAARGLWFEQDLDNARRLRSSDKERAENVMIVDMVRNDLGRIARHGTVRVSNLFEVERFPTVLQLTSTVSAETDAPLAGVMSALFPAASITGAPKARTMEIIADLECSPRRIYTGTIGFVEPGGRAQFNVAIRTMLIDRRSGEAEYGVGGGIVADSDPVEEWQESRLKARVLGPARPSFDLLETMAWNPDGGYLLLGRHLKRLLQSADYFGFQVDLVAVREQLERHAAELPPVPHRVRMTVSRNGDLHISAVQHNPDGGFEPVAIAAAPVDPDNPFLYHKTTNRQLYADAIAARPGFADVLLFNTRGEITESTIANVALELAGELVTPPIACGLLPGTLRGHLVEAGRLREKVITLDDLGSATRCWLLNSVRGFHPLTFVTKA